MLNLFRKLIGVSLISSLVFNPAAASYLQTANPPHFQRSSSNPFETQGLSAVAFSARPYRMLRNVRSFASLAEEMIPPQAAWRRYLVSAALSPLDWWIWKIYRLRLIDKWLDALNRRTEPIQTEDLGRNVAATITDGALIKAKLPPDVVDHLRKRYLVFFDSLPPHLQRKVMLVDDPDLLGNSFAYTLGVINGKQEFIEKEVGYMAAGLDRFYLEMTKDVFWDNAKVSVTEVDPRDPWELQQLNIIQDKSRTILGAKEEHAVFVHHATFAKLVASMTPEERREFMVYVEKYRKTTERWSLRVPVDALLLIITKDGRRTILEFPLGRANPPRVDNAACPAGRFKWSDWNGQREGAGQEAA